MSWDKWWHGIHEQAVFAFPILLAATLSLLLSVAVGVAVGAADGPETGSEGLRISGFLLDEDRQPIGGRVRLEPLPRNHDWHRSVLGADPGGSLGPEPVAVAQTDAAGRFELTAPAAGVWSVVAEAEGRAGVRYVPLVVTGPVELSPAILPRSTPVQIAVRSAPAAPGAAAEPIAAAPIPDAWVLLSSDSSERWAQVRAEGWRSIPRLGRTDAEGRITLDRLPGEAFTVRVYTGSVRDSHRRATAEGAESVRVVLGEASAVRPLRVLDAQGQPVTAGVWVAGSPAWPVGLTDANGRIDVPADLEGPFGLLRQDGTRHTFPTLPAPTREEPVTELALPALPSLEGRVLDARDRRPLVGAVVWPTDDPGAFTLTDARGAYGLPGPEHDRGRAQAEALGYLPQQLDLPSPDPSSSSSSRGPSLPTLALEPAQELSGRVVDRRGEPIPGVGVAVVGESGGGGGEVFRPDPAAARAASDGDGRFVLSGLGPGPSWILEAERPGWRPVRIRATAGEPVTLVLDRALAAHGRVVGQVGADDLRPLEGAEITLRASRFGSSRSTPSAGSEPVRAASDADGHFRVRALPADRIDLRAAAPGFAPLTVTGIDLGPSGPEADSVDLGVLTLVPAVDLRGRVVDGAGEPLEGVEIRLRDDARPVNAGLIASTRRQPVVARTDAEGLFVVPDLVRGQRPSLLFTRSGYLPAWLDRVEAPNAEPLEVVLDTATRLRGRVETVETGEPIADVRVRLRPPDPPPGTVGVVPQRSTNSAETRTDADGRFVFDEVEAGEVQLQALAVGFVPGEPVSMQVPAEGAEALLTLSRGARLEGRVTGPDGEPVAGARVRLGMASGETDIEGNYGLSGVRLGVAGVAATHPDFASKVQEVEIRPGLNRADLRLQRGLRLSGRVVDEDGRGVAGATVTARNRSERGPRGFRGSSDESGDFEIRAVLPGSFGLEAEAPGFAPTRAAGSVEVTDEDIGGLELVLRRGTLLEGRILGLDVAEAARVELTAQLGDAEPRQGLVDYRGHYQVPELEPGHWRLRARLDGGEREAEAWVVIEPGDRRVERDLELVGGLLVEGSVLYLGQALPGASVSLRDPETGVERGITTDHRGRFRLRGVQPGPYRLEVVHGGYSLSQSREIRLDADRELVIEITPGVLVGRVVDAETGAGLPDVLVYIQRQLGTPEPGPLTTVGTDAQGRFVAATVAPGRYLLTARLAGYTPEEQEVEIAAGETTEAPSLALETTGGLRLVVRSTAPRPPSRVEVRVFDLEGRPVHAEEVVLSSFGNGYLQQVPPGNFTLLVDAPLSAPIVVTATVPGDPLELLLQPGAALTVRVPALLDDRQPALLTLSTATGAPHVDADPSGGLRQAWPVRGGAATVEDLPAGTWRLQVVSEDGRTWTGAITTSGTEASLVVLE